VNDLRTGIGLRTGRAINIIFIYSGYPDWRCEDISVEDEMTALYP
jgi:hypothetical protein